MLEYFFGIRIRGLPLNRKEERPVKKNSRITAEISYDALDHNMNVMLDRLKPGTSFCPVVKADAYGHGALQISRRLQSMPSVWGFAVATCEEAMQLRRGGIMKPIILLGYAFPESYEDLVDYDIRPCIFDMESAKELSMCARSLQKDAIVHIAVDTGMSRIGFSPELASVNTILEIASLPGIQVEGLFTHFARADETDMSNAAKQLNLYLRFEKTLRNKGFKVPIRHVSNSAALMRMPEANMDMVRPGITMYGLMPSDEIRDEVGDLQPLMTLKSHVSFVKTLPAGRAISYGGTFVTSAETKVATVPVGYADGYPRMLSGKGTVLIHGQRVPILGRVCMDQFMVDVTSLPDIQRGDEVVLIGKQGSECITAEELGNLSGRFNYELVSEIKKRVPRNYMLSGQCVEQLDYLDRV